MLPKNQRVQQSAFLEVLKGGKSVYAPYLTLKFLKGKQRQESKFSFVVSRAVTKKASDRNLLKRRGYYIIRKHKEDIIDSVTATFFFKRAGVKFSFKDLEREILFLLKKAQLLK